MGQQVNYKCKMEVLAKAIVKKKIEVSIYN